VWGGESPPPVLKRLLEAMKKTLDEYGQTIVEYILIVVFISLVLILVIEGTGEGTIYDSLRKIVDEIGKKLATLLA
jgi:Flp pilus assembly pilin Flp